MEESIEAKNSGSTCAPATEDDIVEIVQKQTQEQEETEEQCTLPTLNDCLDCINVLQKIIVFNKQFPIQS